MDSGVFSVNWARATQACGLVEKLSATRTRVYPSKHSVNYGINNSNGFFVVGSMKAASRWTVA
jgi:hypothetical protein